MLFRSTKVIIALLVIIGIIAIPVIGGYNTLVNLDQTVNIFIMRQKEIYYRKNKLIFYRF